MSASRQNKTEIMNALEHSFFALMKEKSFSDFSIRDLCAYAGVGRSSFYRYYSSKEDVLSSALFRHWHAWCDKNAIKERSKIGLESARSFIRYVYEWRKSFDMIYKNDLDHVFAHVIARNAMTVQDEKDYRKVFFEFGVFGMIKRWWEQGFVDPPEMLISMMESLFPHVVQ